MDNKICIIIPSFNPDNRLLTLIEAILRLNPSQYIIVVNDGSNNAASKIFEELKAQKITVLEHHKNLGKGCALKTAFNHCLQNHPQLIGVVTADDDGQHAPDDILAIAKILETNPKALILGCRDFSAPNIPFKSKLGNLCSSFFFNLICGVYISDTQTGLRGIPTAFLKTLINLHGERFEFEMAMLIEAKKMQIIEYPIKVIYFNKNKASHFRPFKDSIQIGRILLHKNKNREKNNQK